MARRRKMDPERKAFINSLLEHYQPKDAQDIQEMLKDLLGETLQGMLEAEMDDHLGYSKYDYKNKETDDSRNGYSPKTVTSSMGTIDLDIPRDRKGEFEPQIVKKNQTDITTDPHTKNLTFTIQLYPDGNVNSFFDCSIILANIEVDGIHKNNRIFAL